MSSFVQLFLLALLGSILALIGGVVFLYNKKASKLLESFSISFAAGVLITISILGLFPEAFEILEINGALVVLITFIVAFVIENFILELHHHHDAHHKRSLNSSATFIIIGDTIHNFIDGVAIGASFLLNPTLGFITALSTLLHEVPHEIGDFGILLKIGWSRTKVLLVNIFSASFAIVGALFVYFIGVNEELIGVMMAVAAGMFLYLGTVDFLPHVVHEANEGHTKKALFPLLLGVIIMSAVILLIPHSH